MTRSDFAPPIRLSRRSVLGAGVGLTAAGLLAACAPGGSANNQGAASGPKKVGGDLKYAANFDVRTLDPAFSAAFSERFIYYAVYNGLVAYDADLNIVPDLAASWTYSDGGKTVTFKLRPGVVFHDDTPCDATAVKYNFDRILDPAVNSPQRSQLSAVQSVLAPDATTVVLKLSKPWRPLLAALGERPGFISSPTAIKKYGADYGAHGVGTGPYQITEYRQGDHIVLTRFSKNWNAQSSYLNTIRFDNVPDTSAQLARVRTGEATILNNVDSRLVPTIKGANGVSMITNDTGIWFVSTMDPHVAPFNDPNVRQAIGYATDREAIIKSVFQGNARTASTPIGIGWAYNPEYSGPTYNFDLEKAKQALAQSSQKAAVIPFVNSTNSQYTAVAQAMLGGFKDAGLNIKSGSVPAEDFFSQVKSGKISWSVGSWAPRADPDGLLRVLFHTDGAQNTVHYSNPKVDGLLDQAAEVLDTAKAKPIYDQIYQLVNQDAVLQSIIWPDNVIAFRSEVGGVQQYGDGILRFKDMWMS